MHFLNPHPTSLEYSMVTPPVAAYITDAPQHETECTPSEVPEDSTTTPYLIVPRSKAAVSADHHLEKVQNWLETLQRLEIMANTEYKTFMCYCTEFAIISGKLWCKNSNGQHKKVVLQAHHLFLITIVHNDVGHHGVYVTTTLLTEQYCLVYSYLPYLPSTED